MMERYYPAAEVTPRLSLDLLRDDLDLIGGVGGKKRNKAKAKAQRQSRKRNR